MPRRGGVIVEGFNSDEVKINKPALCTKYVCVSCAEIVMRLASINAHYSSEHENATVERALVILGSSFDVFSRASF